jgi:hypothetical protein
MEGENIWTDGHSSVRTTRIPKCYSLMGLGRMNRYIAAIKERRELSSITALASISLVSVSLEFHCMTHSGKS